MKKILLVLLYFINLINIDAQVSITVGSGTLTSGSQESSPINIWYKSHHCQILYSAAEINAAGWIGQGQITKLGFNIISSPVHPLPNFTIKLKNTISTDVINYDAFGFTTVYNTSSYSPSTGGFELLNLTNNFIWDGTSNLLIDVCFDQVPNYDASGVVATYTCTNGDKEYAYAKADDSTQCSVQTYTSSSYAKPQLQLTIANLAPCTGMPNAGNAITSNPLICLNTSFYLSLENGTFGTGITYQWQNSADNVTWSNLGGTQLNWGKFISSITDTTYYRCISTCSNSPLSSTSTPVVVNYNPLINCYCTPNYSLNCSGDNFVYFSLANVTNQITNCNTNGYTDSTYSSRIINLYAGNTYTLNANINNSGGNGKMAAGAWIDFNQNGDFETSEFYSLGYGMTNLYNTPITIPINILNGTVRMRLKVDAANANSNTTLDPCINNNYSYNGQIIDYKVNLIAAAPCTSTPNIATSISTKTAICTNSPFTLNLKNNSISSEIMYQWQSSPNGSVWTNIGVVQNTIPYTINNQTITTYYRCISTCTNAVSSSTSIPVVVNQNLPTACYCIPVDGVCDNSFFTNVTLETLNDNPTCNQEGYVNNIGVISPVILNANQNYTIGATFGGSDPRKYSGVWIDFNQNGFFSDDEYTFLGNNMTAATITGTISVPFTAKGGSTRMRLKAEGTYYDFQGLNPCLNYEANNQTLDYEITIVPVTPCSAAINAGNCTSSDSSVCSTDNFTLNLTGNTIASAINYQWQYSTNNSTWINLTSSQTNIPYSISNQTVTTYYRCIATCISSSLTSTSSVVKVSQNSILDCHCIPPPSNCSNGNEIRRVSISTLNNSSFCSTDGYTNYSSSVPSVSLTAAQSYSLNVKVGNDFNNYTSVWIDYNQNGKYDTNEYTDLTYVTGAGDSTIHGNITIPANAFLGNTRMRVRNTANSTFYDDQACAEAFSEAKSALNFSSNYGETEDYMVTILQQNCGTINFPSKISAVKSNTICYAETDTLDISYTFPSISGITYQWKSSTGGSYVNVGSAMNTSSLIITPTITTSYFCEIMCNSTVMLNTDTAIITIRPSTNISGTVTVFPNTGTPVAGRVILYKYEPFFTQFDSVAGQNIGAAGDYNFTSFNSGIYIVKAIPNLLSLQIAYGDSAVNWKTAKQIIHGCSVNDVQNIQVKALPSATTAPGPGRLSGIITQTIGFGQKTIAGPTNSNAFKTMTPGQPIGGIIVKGGRNPGGQMFTQTITEPNPISPAYGTYSLTGLPVGDYFILVDITGLDTNNTYHVRITPSDTVYKNLDFTVDSIQINPVYETNVGVKEIMVNEHNIKVYPNPASNYLTIQYILQNNSTVTIELYDILGKSIKELLPETKLVADKYKSTFPLNDLKSGLYFMKININGTESTIKISVSN